MSEPIPESIPTSADPRSHRPVKRARGPQSNTASSAQAHEIDSLFLDPNKPITLPPASSTKKPSLPAPPEIVANVQGSSAGAGSGEFHVYKASRRREYERLRMMDEEAKKEEEDARWEREERERRKRDEEKTRKNRERRNKRKNKQQGGKKDNGDGNGADGGASGNVEIETVKGKAGGGGLQAPRRDREDDEHGSGFGVAEVAKENGMTIHEDD
ncbi:uncharacterized protein Z518_07735 [Rhinocladiella mackenziei CBS 650.93]|uniref:DUF1168-domain-containing protein n=1 Tax=Rhinocladiella mackenziei CBS 650.93 TaxID=1442369 RepID=A0A0D2ILW8_9EURO|nr:uncharacterized protein Z518_07735 [Rhinocladiella mackenziei CBS 650.93]KIX04181.1 hypothetical protein Z518_07735 [Rhinocladiella mackenziei CBS 650.93]